MDGKKQIRLILLNKESELFESNCKHCKFRASEFSSGCKSCDIYKHLREIGSKLLELSKQKNVLFITKEEREMGLTVERYNELKEKGFADRKIITEFGMNNASFYKWKSENGLVGKSKYSNQKDKVTAPESDFKPVPTASDEVKLKIAFKENERLRTEIESLEEKVQSYEEEIEKLKVDITKHIEENEQLTEELQKHVEQATELVEENHRLKDEIKKLEEENSALNKLSKQQSFHVAELESKLKYLQAEKSHGSDTSDRIRQLNKLLMEELLSITS